MPPNSDHHSAERLPTHDAPASTLPPSTASQVTVTLPANLHARPAGKLAQAAARFHSIIRIDYGGKSVNPTGVLAVMALGATAGSTVTVSAEGDDARQATEALAVILATAE